MTQKPYTLSPLVGKRISLLEGPDPFASREAEDFLQRRGFSLLVSVRRDINYPLSWAHRPDDPDSRLRAYNWCFSGCGEPGARNLFKPPDKIGNNEEVPSRIDLVKFREYCLYELAHNRSIPIWFQRPRLRDIVTGDLQSFFAPHLKTLDTGVRELLRTQRDRTLAAMQEDPGWLPDLSSHATTLDDAVKIAESGVILSGCRARGLSGSELAFDPRNIVNDPADYFEYIMFGDDASPITDWVVYQRVVGRSPTDRDNPLTWQEFSDNFLPAVKFVFRTIDLIRHPLYCSDGLHDVKIRDELALDPLVTAIIVPDGLPQSDALHNALTTKGLGDKAIFQSFAGLTPEQWAERTHLAANGLAKGE